MKSIIVAFAAILLIIAMPFVFQSIEDAVTNEASETLSGVSTGSSIYTANVTLGQDIYRDSVNSILSVSSNNTSDTPSAYSFNSVSRTLEVSGLLESDTRTLSIDFNIDNETLDDGSAAFFSIFRWFYMFVILGMAGGAIYSFFD